MSEPSVMMNPPDLYRKSGYSCGAAKKRDEFEMVRHELNWFDLALKYEPLECHPVALKHWQEGYDAGVKGG